MNLGDPPARKMRLGAFGMSSGHLGRKLLGGGDRS
jgi:hypothetical protein